MLTKTFATLLFTASMIFLILLIGGCGPAATSKAPAIWPDQFNDLQLYYTPNACIYASSASVAGEADRLIKKLIKNLPEEHNINPGMALVFVTDKNDQPLITDLSGIWDTDNNNALTKANNFEASDQSHNKTQDSLNKIKEAGLDVTDILKMSALPIQLQTIWPKEFPQELADKIAWSVAVPTKAAIKDVYKKMINAAMDKKNITGAQRALVAPYMALVESKLIAVIAIERDSVIYELIVNSQSHLTDKDKENIIKALVKDNEN